MVTATASLLACTASVAPGPAPQPVGPEPPTSLVYVGPRRCEDGSMQPSDCPVYFVIDPHEEQDPANSLNLAAYPGQQFTCVCAVRDGTRIEDGAGGASRSWYQVELGNAPGGHAYISELYVVGPPGVRECERATPWSRLERRNDPAYL
ncbi:hypothetical protein ACM614_19120 [Streptomyces sp. 12297]